MEKLVGTFDRVRLHSQLNQVKLFVFVNNIKASSCGSRWRSANVFDVLKRSSPHGSHGCVKTRFNVIVGPHIHCLFLAPNYLCICNNQPWPQLHITSIKKKIKFSMQLLYVHMQILIIDYNRIHINLTLKFTQLTFKLGFCLK